METEMPSAPDPILIRPVTPDDLAAITTIYAHAVSRGTASFELDPPSEDEMRRRHGMLKAGGHPYLVATDGERVVGYAYAGPYRPRAAYRSAVEDSIYLSPDAQGRGIGRLLLTALIEAATEAGFRQMVGIIGDSRHQASIRLHQALGFRPVGVLENVGWKHGRWLDSVIMQRALGSGSERPPTL
jgi:L-amino acid N-acyltransferase YncA